MRSDGTSQMNKTTINLEEQFQKGKTFSQNFFRSTLRNTAMVEKDINLALMPVQMTRKSKKTDQFNEKFSYNIDSYIRKRDMNSELRPTTPGKR